MHTYIQSEKHEQGGLWTVGHYGPAGAWIPESDHDSAAKAAARVALLNGGTPEQTIGTNRAGLAAAKARDIGRDARVASVLLAINELCSALCQDELDDLPWFLRGAMDASDPGEKPNPPAEHRAARAYAAGFNAFRRITPP